MRVLERAAGPNRVRTEHRVHFAQHRGPRAGRENSDELGGAQRGLVVALDDQGGLGIEPARDGHVLAVIAHIPASDIALESEMRRRVRKTLAQGERTAGQLLSASLALTLEELSRLGQPLVGEKLKAIR